MDSLYNENHIFGRLFRKFMDLFPQATKPTKKLLALFLIGQLCTEHFTSVRNLHKTFLSSVCDKKLNSYYYALSNDKIANTQIRQILAKMSLSIIPESLAKEPVVIAIDEEIFLGSLADCAQTAKNSDIIMEFLAAMGWNQGYAA